jgi:hypothetical protein
LSIACVRRSYQSFRTDRTRRSALPQLQRR